MCRRPSHTTETPRFNASSLIIGSDFDICAPSTTSHSCETHALQPASIESSKSCGDVLDSEPIIVLLVSPGNNNEHMPEEVQCQVSTVARRGAPSVVSVGSTAFTKPPCSWSLREGTRLASDASNLDRVKYSTGHPMPLRAQASHTPHVPPLPHHKYAPRSKGIA